MTISPFRNYIAGHWVDDVTEVANNVNPTNIDDVIGTYARGPKQDAERVIAAAKSGMSR
jgi:aldehyde dehydrogenase (NAD+)